MVVFVCGSCGDALKRPSIDNHLYKCQCSSLSCLDCGKDFYDDDYKNHIKCISEVEKYSSKDYVPKVQKGEVKQENWKQQVLNCLNQATYPSYLKNYVDKIKALENIPKKKPKFMKFARDNLTMRSERHIEELWDIINKREPMEVEGDKVDSVISGGNISTSENHIQNVAALHASCKTKISIEDIHTNLRNSLASITPDLKDIINDLLKMDDIPRKRKLFISYMENKFNIKKSKTVEKLWSLISYETRECGQETVTGNQTGVQQTDETAKDTKLSKRQKKEQRREMQTKVQKKMKRKFIEAENIPCDIDKDNETKPQKRKRIISDDEMAEIKKSKHDIENSSNECNIEINNDSSKKLHPKKFNWATFMLEKVKGHKNQRIKLTRLKNQVIGECMNVCGDVNSYESLDKLFNKALNRTAELRLDKDHVSLIGS